MLRLELSMLACQSISDPDLITQNLYRIKCGGIKLAKFELRIATSIYRYANKNLSILEVKDSIILYITHYPVLNRILVTERDEFLSYVVVQVLMWRSAMLPLLP